MPGPKPGCSECLWIIMFMTLGLAATREALFSRFESGRIVSLVGHMIWCGFLIVMNLVAHLSTKKGRPDSGCLIASVFLYGCLSGIVFFRFAAAFINGELPEIHRWGPYIVSQGTTALLMFGVGISIIRPRGKDSRLSAANFSGIGLVLLACLMMATGGRWDRAVLYFFGESAHAEVKSIRVEKDGSQLAVVTFLALDHSMWHVEMPEIEFFTTYPTGARVNATSVRYVKGNPDLAEVSENLRWAWLWPGAAFCFYLFGFLLLVVGVPDCLLGRMRDSVMVSLQGLSSRVRRM